MHTTPKIEWGFVLTLSFVISCFGWISDSDQISIWIIHFIDSILIEDFWKPYRLPPPANGEYGFRPLSVLLMKGYLYFVDAHAPIPRSLVVAKTFLSSMFFSWVTLQWCKRSMPSHRAFFWTAIATISGPHLFGLWLLSEFDGLGAAFILLALLYWSQPDRTRVQFAIMIASCTCAMFLKESTAIILFAMLSAGIFQKWRTKKSGSQELFVLLFLVSMWVFFAWDLINGGQTSYVGRYPWRARLPVLGFTAWQYIYFITPPAIFGLLIASVQSKYQKTAVRISLIVLLLLPPLVTYSHYESMYFSPLWLGILSTALLYFVIVIDLVIHNSIHATFALAAQAALWFALILSSTPREDMAVRIFLPALPSLLIILDQKLTALWKNTNASYGTRILMACSIWPFFAISTNTITERVWIAPQNHDGVKKLTDLAPQSQDLVLFNNFTLSLGNETFLRQESFEVSEKGISIIFQKPQLLRTVDQEVLRDIMAHPLCNRTHLFRSQAVPKATLIQIVHDLDDRGLIHATWPPQMHHTADHLTTEAFPKVMWGFNLNEPLDIEQKYQENQSIWSYWNAKRPREYIPRMLQGDFSYTRRPMGAMGLLHQSPDDHLPLHNFMEDLNTTQTTTGQTTLQKIIEDRGILQYESTQSYAQIPSFLHEIPRRIIQGWPIIHRFSYKTNIHKMTSPQKSKQAE